MPDASFEALAVLPVIVLSRIVTDALVAYTPPPRAGLRCLCRALSRTTVPASTSVPPAATSIPPPWRRPATRPPLIVSPAMCALAVPVSVKIRKSGAPVARVTASTSAPGPWIVSSELTSGSGLCSSIAPVTAGRT